VPNNEAWELGGSLVLPVRAGEEVGGIACRSFQCTVAVLLLLCARILGTNLDLRPAVSACEHLTATRESWIDAALDILGGGPVYSRPERATFLRRAIGVHVQGGGADRGRRLDERRTARVVAVGSPVAGASLEIGYPGVAERFVPLLVETTVSELLAAEMWGRSAAP
jgi:hypothetical protein